MCARKRLAIIRNLRIRSSESYLDRRKRRDCQKEKMKSVVKFAKVVAFFEEKNFQTGCEHAYHVNETKITYVKLIA